MIEIKDPFNTTLSFFWASRQQSTSRMFHPIVSDGTTISFRNILQFHNFIKQLRCHATTHVANILYHIEIIQYVTNKTEPGHQSADNRVAVLRPIVTVFGRRTATLCVIIQPIRRCVSACFPPSPGKTSAAPTALSGQSQSCRYISCRLSLSSKLLPVGYSLRITPEEKTAVDRSCI